MERGHSPEMLIVLQKLRRQAGIRKWRLAVAHDGSQKETEECHIRQHHEEKLVHRRVHHCSRLVMQVPSEPVPSPRRLVESRETESAGTVGQQEERSRMGSLYRAARRAFS